MPAKNGDKVKVHYKGTLEDGTQFDSSEGRDPLEFTLGANQVIPGFEKAVDGMESGDKKTINIPSDEAYGQYRDDMVVDVPRNMIPGNIDPQPGLQFMVPTRDGGGQPVTVLEMSEDSIKLDANHRLAGKDLTFEIELVEFKNAN